MTCLLWGGQITWRRLKWWVCSDQLMSTFWHLIQDLLMCFHSRLPRIHSWAHLFILHLLSLSALLSHLFISYAPTVLMMCRGEIGWRVSGGCSDVVAEVILIGCRCHGGKLEKCRLGKVLAVWPWQVTSGPKVDSVGLFWFWWLVITDDSCRCCFLRRGKCSLLQQTASGRCFSQKNKTKNKTHAALSWWCRLTSKDIWKKNSTRTETTAWYVFLVFFWCTQNDLENAFCLQVNWTHPVGTHMRFANKQFSHQYV